MGKVNHTNQRCVGGGEGFAIYYYESDDAFYMLIDSTAMLDLLSAEDAEGMSGQKVLKFNSEIDREDHFKKISGIHL